MYATMVSSIRRRRVFRLTFLLALVLSALPVTASATPHQATRTTLSFTATQTEITQEGEVWVDEDGIFHLRNEIEIDEISGDITGTATLTINVDSNALGLCQEDSCPSFADVWGTIVITDEAGSWSGRFTQNLSDVPGEEFSFTAIAMRGLGGNAGKSFIGEITESGEASVTVEGILSTMATPYQSMNTTAVLCFTETSDVGNFISSGVIDGFGHAESTFISAGSFWTPTYNIFGEVTLSDESGTATIGFVLGGQDVGDVSHGFGNYMITGGTGAYAELYGQGRVTGSALEMPQCEFGFGVRIQFIGEAHYNSVS